MVRSLSRTRRPPTGRLLTIRRRDAKRSQPHGRGPARIVVGCSSGIMIGASEVAAMVGVGSRVQGGFNRLLIGSASHGVLHHAQAPVAVVSGHQSATTTP